MTTESSSVEAPLVAAELDDIRFGNWNDIAGISRPTVFDLV